ncbi:MAG TPA: hypothetical protein VF575_03695 [Candidatus Saccharimonadales bacterium]|jgi:hypothetical protein
MTNQFAEMLSVGGKSNSLGKVSEIIDATLSDQSRLNELYECLFDDDAWVRMRAADAIEKVCRQKPDWLLSYIDKFIAKLAESNQPSIQWHLSQIYAQVDLTLTQKQFVIKWLENLLANSRIDWIVAANAMDTLAQFTRDGSFKKDKMLALLAIQQQHKSNAVVRRATKLLTELSAK